MVEASLTAQPAPTDRWLTWKVYGVLMVLAVLAALAGIPYIADFISASIPTAARIPPVLLIVVLAFSAVVERVLPSALAAGLGLWLGNQIGWGAPILRAWLSNERSEPGVLARLRAILLPGIVVGVGTGLLVLGLSWLSEGFMPSLGDAKIIETVSRIAPWKGLLVAFSAGVTEEIFFRLGLMTFCAWLLVRLVRRDRPGAIVAWTANVLAVLPFGLLHLTNVAALGGEITPAAVAFVVALNGLPGLAFGWLYWRRGLEAAMLAHFSIDVVLKAVVPLVIGLVG